MAEIDNVSRKILEDASVEREKILDEARKKASDIIGEAEKKAEEINRDGKLKAQEKYKEVFDVEVIRAKTELNQKATAYKIDLIDEVIAKAKEKLSSLDKKEYEKFVKKTLKTLNIRNGYYQIGSREKNISGKMIESIAKLKKAGGKPDFKKGIKIIKGKTQYNITADSLIDPDIDDIRMEAALYLFGKEK
jgi:V/A-type H+-transporting ATPase subunit E